MTGAVAPPVGVVVIVGYGNCPPARKLASLPSSVIRFGSARICSRFLSCSALMVAPKFRSGRNANRFSRSEKLTVLRRLPSLALQLAEARRSELLRADAPDQLVVGAEEIEADLRQRHPVDGRELHLQQDLPRLRRRRRLQQVDHGLRARLRQPASRFESSADFTVPVSTIVSPVPVTVIGLPSALSSICLRKASHSDMSLVTATS